MRRVPCSPGERRACQAAERHAPPPVCSAHHPVSLLPPTPRTPPSPPCAAANCPARPTGPLTDAPVEPAAASKVRTSGQRDSRAMRWLRQGRWGLRQRRASTLPSFHTRSSSSPAGPPAPGPPEQAILGPTTTLCSATPPMLITAHTSTPCASRSRRHRRRHPRRPLPGRPRPRPR